MMSLLNGEMVLPADLAPASPGRLQGGVVEEIPHERRALLANLVIAAMFVGVFVSGATREAASNPITVDLLEAATPVAALALTMLLSLYLGLIDISVASVFSLVVVVIGQSAAPTDIRIVGALLLAVIAALFIGLAGWWLEHPVLITAIGYFCFRGLATFVSDGVTGTARFSESSILSSLNATTASIPNQVIIVVFIATGLTWCFAFTDLGRRIRTCGADPAAARSANIDVVHTRAIVHIAVGLITGTAAVLSIAHFGATAPEVGDSLVVSVIVALVVANAGLGRWSPSPGRTVLAALAVTAAGRELALRGWSVSSTDMLGGIVVLMVLACARLLGGIHHGRSR